MTSAAAGENVPQGNGEIVLVVDDNDQVREVTLKRIESLGYAVLKAKDGPSALRLIDLARNVALMLTDIVMPGGMSGYDLVRAVRKTNPSIQTLLSSGFNAHEPREGTDEGKGFKILGKPYSRVNLARALHEALIGQEPGDV